MTRPSFWAPIDAAVRQGAKEITQALPAFPDSIRPVEEPGTMGNPTQQMVTENIRGDHSFDDMVNRHAAREREEPKEQGIERE